MASSTLNLTTLNADLCQIAIKAGDVMMEIYARDFKIAEKEDRSPVTEADGAAEEVILAALKVLTPEIPVVAEESASAGVIPEIGSRFYLVDPLDGTKEFINRNGEFTVNIALIEDGVPIAGVVYAPAIGRIFTGNKEDGATEIGVEASQLGTAKKIGVRDPEGGPLVAIASRSHRDAKTEEYLNHYNISEIVTAGSSLKFCLVATGEADIYPRHGRTMEWDTAAGHAVLRAAGGDVTCLDGSPFLYGKAGEGFANGFFVAKGMAS
jgi:3'(2'), 5'-bisphosphate nucleotidase